MLSLIPPIERDPNGIFLKEIIWSLGNHRPRGLIIERFLSIKTHQSLRLDEICDDKGPKAPDT